MLSARHWTRLVIATVALAIVGIVACEEEDAVFGPLVDETPPTVAITDVVGSNDTLTVSVQAEDFISVAAVVTEIRRTDQFETVITPEGDTLVLGRLLYTDTTRTAGRVVKFNVNTTFVLPFTQPTQIEVRAVAIDSQENEAATSVYVIVGGGDGGGLGGPQVSIYSPLAGATLRDNTLVRVGIRASDPTGLAQINVVLTGLPLATVPAADTIVFATFVTSIDTLLDFFIPAGALGTLTISAEAINLNTISAFAVIVVNVATEVPNDTIRPTVSLLASGGVQRRQDEPPRMEADDSLLFEMVAQDFETAITRMGVTVVVRNNRPGGAVIDTFVYETTFSPSISGTVPATFALVPATLTTVFALTDIPDTLFMEVTGWAFDQATPTANCGATVDVTGVANNLRCSTGAVVHALGLRGGQLERFVISGRTVGFPQGALIADAVVDTLRELLLLSDFNFGIVRPFDLANDEFERSVPVGSSPWGMFIDNSLDQLLVGNSGGTNVSVVSLGPRVTGGASIGNEVDRYQTQDLKVYRVIEDYDALGRRIFPVTFFEYSDRPQFVAQAANGSILYSTVPALAGKAGTIREYDPVDREIRFFIQYADRIPTTGQPEIQIINADSVLEGPGSTHFFVCDHTRGAAWNVGRSCIRADSLPDAQAGVATMRTSADWDTEVYTQLDIPSIALQDTTFLAASGDREYIAFGEGDTPDRAGRIILYRSADTTITNSLLVSDLPGNAEQQVRGLALNRDGSLGVARGTHAYFFGPDYPGGPNVLRLLGQNEDINDSGTGAALHPDNDQFSNTVDTERLSFLGSDDASLEIVDAYYYSFSRGTLFIRDPIAGPVRITRRFPADPPEVVLRVYGVTENGVVVIPVLSTDIVPIP